MQELRGTVVAPESSNSGYYSGTDTMLLLDVLGLGGSKAD